ncbi:uncharacterized protein BP01DRAFT_108264 [Aspergillus saccharolyticus JOP 1030-1]|uniref:Uncharacterized protein n=1 Tax=Aspergillus saccharolyticus JOP 1030-1 TaxID=1450539 RepID=A0A318Z7H3_9EURO|nr:hypothetical protein BP01DRAFT_108264 [Aspergillus saccharolyticus JOP 1030-1]PYH43069.1 hypothetical protein BP01DRAFT_108264 [Aspergillus saccharolyticus JOP 1030-1]
MEIDYPAMSLRAISVRWYILVLCISLLYPLGYGVCSDDFGGIAPVKRAVSPPGAP